MNSPYEPYVKAVPAFGAALALHESGALAKAREAYLDLIDEPALTAICLHQLGLIAAVKAQHQRAAELFSRASRLEPTLVMARMNLSSALDRIGNPVGAVAALIDLGCMLQSQRKRHQEAKDIYQRVLRRDPVNYAAHVNLGTTLAWMGYPKAAASYLLSAALLYGRLAPGVGVLACDLINTLRGQLDNLPAADALPPGQPSGAIEKIEDALTTLGKVLTELGYPEEGLLCYRTSVALAPGYALGHWNLSLALLSLGDFSAGWTEYEWRWHWNEFPEIRRMLPVPTWRGEDLTGKHILVWAEQGYGDAIQFAPLVRCLLTQAQEVLLEAPTPLARLFRTSFPDLTVVNRPDTPHMLLADPLPDFVIPLMSLPHYFGLTLADLPLATAYLNAAPDIYENWAARIPRDHTSAVGLVWAGRTTHSDDARRVPFDTLRPLFDLPDIRWYSLQVGPRQGDAAMVKAPVVDLFSDLKDFAETAAAIAQLDIVITVVTGVGHLAGAMGKPIWLMLPKIAEWRWGREGQSRLWYPGLRLFRQEVAGDWTAVISAVKEELKKQLPIASQASPTR